MTSFSKYLNQKLQNPDFKRAFLRVHLFDDLADQILALRNKRGYTQTQLAKKAKTTQAVISRIENGSVNSTLIMIQKVAESLNASIKLDVIPDEEMNNWECILGYSQLDENQSQDIVPVSVNNEELYSKFSELICDSFNNLQTSTRLDAYKEHDKVSV